MIGELWAAIGAAVLTLLAAIAAWPKTRAAARKLNAETDDLIVARLYAEIERLDLDMTSVRSELEEVKTDAADEKRTLEIENRQLKRLIRVLAIELHEIDPQNKKLASVAKVLSQVFAIEPEVPDDMKAILSPGRKQRSRK